MSIYRFNVGYLIEDDFVHPKDGYVQVVFPAGEDTGTFHLKINSDMILELNEKFKVTIVDVSLPYGFILGDNKTIDVTILDSNRKYNYVICYILHALLV